jgi:hypothetical protein
MKQGDVIEMEYEPKKSRIIFRKECDVNDDEDNKVIIPITNGDYYAAVILGGSGDTVELKDSDIINEY